MITKFNFTDRTVKSYAIRKLTPPECFRLMGVREDVIRIMQSTNAEAVERVEGFKSKGAPEDMAISSSQQYKQAGNSIVVDVLAAIYEQLWYPKPVKRRYEQLSLFAEDILPKTPHTSSSVDEKVILTTFSGYDSQLMAADVLKERHPDFRWTCVGWSDIDKYACQMHDLIFPQYADRALGDITKIDWYEVKRSLQGRDIDLFTYSSPCQDISQAGKQMGLQEGSETRSALLWRVSDAVEVLRPKYLLQENVAALVSQKFMPDFQKWLDKLSQLGYVSKWARLNAKDYGAPQNRDRVFCVSMRKDVAFDYRFPEPIALSTCLEDVLDEEVPTRYFLKDEAVGKFLNAYDKDTAIFVPFDLPPTHEAAMFLKTLLCDFMDVEGVWQMAISDAERKIEVNRKNVVDSWQNWQTDRNLFSKAFQQEFELNMKRKKNEAR